MHDACVRHLPIDQIKPELLERQEQLTEAFCAGVWSGLGYAFQRRYLEMKYRDDPFAKDHLWDRSALASSSYEVGTNITDHFEVVSKTPDSIIMRAGASPRVQEPRSDDGLFEISTQMNRDEGVVVFSLKSVFFNSVKGHETPDKAPFPWVAVKLHQAYAKILMESAVQTMSK
ncbi:MAG: hypothetical protein Q9159_003093 [Coniocarpon cinnabarinum]